ncbi:DUF4236 domain-containing protein [Solimicrobium silvestre]|uniref:DUF4236 domain-containing protein n=1 Tax=Solimicrobium silvestre TaxID=2099400 RepID=UPI0013FE1401|nr:DUF4236 domain-containing protein [Solimicrobium silvestre]
MGFYIRKSVSVGPFRFNLSKSGIGVSTGIKGLRVGTGPRGNYITVGKSGLYYRATLNGPKITPGGTSNGANPISPTDQSKIIDQMVAIESGPLSSMQDETSFSLINELNTKEKRPNYWKWTLGAGLIGLWFLPPNTPQWLTVLSVLILIGCTSYIAIRDVVAKSVVLCYKLDPNNETAYQCLHDAFLHISECSKKWRINSKGAVRDSKYHAGAGTLVSRKDATFSKGLPPRVKCNLEVPIVKADSISIYFMPDRLLVYSDNEIGAVNYKDLVFNAAAKRFIEEDSVPKDAEVIDHTWKYVNKKGGPDKRFKDNKQIPVVLYEELHFSSSSGLNELFQISKHSIANKLTTALKNMDESIAI